MDPVLDPVAYATRAGQKIGVSRWLEISQSQICLFADATHDHQFIHTDPQRASRESTYGGTIAHGFLSLSLLTTLSHDVLPSFSSAIGVNYGFDKLRFLTPVPAGSHVRAHYTLDDFSWRNETEFLTRYSVTVEIEGTDRPALVADWITMTILQRPANDHTV